MHQMLKKKNKSRGPIPGLVIINRVKKNKNKKNNKKNMAFWKMVNMHKHNRTP